MNALPLPPPELDPATIAGHLRTLASRGTQREYPRNTLVIDEGEAGDSLFVILSGRVKVYAADANDREVTYGVYGPGSYFGEMSLDGGPRSASVITLEPTVCATIPNPKLREFLSERPEFALHLLLTVIHRARQATAIARSLALDGVYSRLIRFLGNNTIAQPDGTHALTERMSHQEMASRIGASREMVRRILKDLETGGYVTTRDQRLLILSKLPGQW